MSPGSLSLGCTPDRQAVILSYKALKTHFHQASSARGRQARSHRTNYRCKTGRFFSLHTGQDIIRARGTVLTSSRSDKGSWVPQNQATGCICFPGAPAHEPLSSTYSCPQARVTDSMMMTMSNDSAHVCMAIVSNGLCVLGYTQYTSEQPCRDQLDPSSICSRKWVKFFDFISVTLESI